MITTISASCWIRSSSLHHAFYSYLFLFFYLPPLNLLLIPCSSSPIFFFDAMLNVKLPIYIFSFEYNKCIVHVHFSCSYYTSGIPSLVQNICLATWSTTGGHAVSQKIYFIASFTSYMSAHRSIPVNDGLNSFFYSFPQNFSGIVENYSPRSLIVTIPRMIWSPLLRPLWQIQLWSIHLIMKMEMTLSTS